LKEAAVTPVLLGINKETKRETGDIMMKVNNYSFLNCSCGLKIKIPPDFKNKELSAQGVVKNIQFRIE